jgi:glycosyltransferase involved in cell wall biosynthesis
MTGCGRICRQLEGSVRAARQHEPMPANTAGLIAEIEAAAVTLPPPAWPALLVGRPCHEPPVLWHAHCLRALHDRYRDWQDLGDAARARLLYHLRWLCRHFGSSDQACLPRVSIVIPVYNRAHLIGPTMESCLSQTAPVEIVITDDGSTDDLAAALMPYAGRIVLLRQQNRGISHARRAAIDAATGDFVHFLDSDDFLLPEAVADKLAAFAAVPDAEFCYGGVVNYDPDLVVRAFVSYENPDGGPLCPTTDLGRAIAHRHPFLPSVVMMPRWVLLELDAFHEGLRRGEDVRLWFRLAMRRPKVLGTIAESTIRRCHAESLGKRFGEPSCSHAIAMMMNLCDLLAEPDLWPGAFSLLHSLTLADVWDEANRGEAPDLSVWRSRLIAAIAALGNGDRIRDLSPKPILVLLLAGLRSLGDELGIADEPQFAFHRALDAAIATAARTAAPLADEDVEWWLTAEHAGLFDASAARIFAALAEEFESDGKHAHLVPAVRLLLHLANPAFDPRGFGRRTLSALAVNRVHARSAAGSTSSPAIARILDGLTSRRSHRRRGRALDLLDRVIADGSWAVWLASVHERGHWRNLGDLLGGSGNAGAHFEILQSIVFADHDPAPVDRPSLRARARVHARALARALGSTERRHCASLAIVVAASGSDGLRTTIDSALALGRVEIVVSGDQGDTDLVACLAPYAGKVRFIGRVRPDRVTACNVAIAHAASDYLLVVEQGDRLDAGAVAAHLAAFEAEPRAQLTWSGTAPVDSSSNGGLMAGVAAGRRWRPGEWTAPRWFILAVGPVDCWIAAHAFERYAFRMAAYDPVVVHVARPPVTRQDGAPSPDPRSSVEAAIVDMLNLADLLARPHYWRHCFALTRRMRPGAGLDSASPRDAILHAMAAERLTDAIRRLGDGAHRRGYSPLPPIALTLAGLATVPGDVARSIEQALLEAACSAAMVTGIDRDALENDSPSWNFADLSAGLRLLEARCALPPGLDEAIALIGDVLKCGDGAPAGGSQEARAPRSS